MGYHKVFSLEDGERGETDLVEFKIDTGDAIPKRQAVRRIPFAARQEITDQLEKMQSRGVIEPSESPWASWLGKKMELLLIGFVSIIEL